MKDYTAWTVKDLQEAGFNVSAKSHFHESKEQAEKVVNKLPGLGEGSEVNEDKGTYWVNKSKGSFSVSAYYRGGGGE